MKRVRPLIGRVLRRLGLIRTAKRGPSEPIPAVPIDTDVSALGLVDTGMLPYRGGAVVPVERLGLDAEGVHDDVRSGGEFHPVRQTQLALACLDMHAQTGDTAYLDIAIGNARAAVPHLVGDYLPYDFDFSLHGDPRNTIHAVWFSGMAQGQYLSLVSRLAQVTGDAEWRALADRMFATLDEHHAFDALPDRPWVSFIDQDGLFWFEEYAGDVAPMRVLNGHLFAIFGVYDYWRLTGRADAQALFAEAAGTVLRAFPRLRVPGQASWYGLRVQDNPRAQSEGYHRIHIAQLRYVAAMTGDARFTRLADELESDCPVSELPLALLPLLPKF